MWELLLPIEPITEAWADIIQPALLLPIPYTHRPEFIKNIKPLQYRIPPLLLLPFSPSSPLLLRHASLIY